MPKTENTTALLSSLNALEIQSAETYAPCSDLWIISCYFNSGNYQTKYANFKVFEKIIRKSNINLLIVECAFGDDDFILTAFPNVLQVRSPHIMWQKERLINLAIAKLAKDITKVAWVDCDVLFSNPNWAQQTSALLDEFPVVQLFQTAIRLPRNLTFYKGEGEIWESFGYIKTKYPTLIFRGDFFEHGHTGFAWAARRDLLEAHGLYDACISGGGDHYMAHAMCGDFNNTCYGQAISAQFRSHFLRWGKRFYQDVQGKIGYTPGTLLHLWHGDTENRQYLQRHNELINSDFDPSLDLHTGESGTWEWNSNKPNLHKWLINYFQCRREDGAS